MNTFNPAFRSALVEALNNSCPSDNFEVYDFMAMYIASSF